MEIGYHLRTKVNKQINDECITTTGTVAGIACACDQSWCTASHT
jgi:hypothetical protein